MTITKTTLKQSIERAELMIQEYNKQSKEFTFLASSNDKKVLRLGGNIEAFESLLNNY